MPPIGKTLQPTILLETPTMWTKPEYTEMRFGFEVTMYIANR
jgi:pyrroloquinoline quinone biosynthesis protein A